ncbi:MULTISPECIES: CDP-diacylglycerol--glycerol-3-phosphate 3-phosphatidyltransferase [Methylocystis]|uniref:CDP-diacylglycerol--glycerol-3-phosphate 3-phosphatidyltransferase n=1 Tax=Methylocystis TaxID=133 RepID=UPI00210BEF6F|nr:CDP-diacylglycerol--glycerol-3-phosphate 3-phosphatidyltransferase [Methylocystis suflitae]MCQ4189264.1 CDP-diacylglycerol--glycerol-3-phosphate 3-phosphatidyltransferase [Methylocystis suflitae]
MSQTALTAKRRSQALALPNLLTYGRMAAVPVVAGLLLGFTEHWARWAALGIFIAAGVTDFLDGYFARIWQQQSPLGRMLDPIADKLLVATTLMALVADRTVAGWTIWAAIIILCREILVSGLREHLAELKVRLPVSAIAKWKTAAQLVALGFLIAGPAGEVVLSGTVKIGAALLWAAAILTLYTGFDYLQSAWNHFGEDEGT